MDIEDWTSARYLPDLFRELKALDLLENVAELEAFGFTVLPPEKVGSAQDHVEHRDAVISIACERRDCGTHELAEVFDDNQELMRFVLWDNPLFESTILNPSALGLIQYLLGTNCILSLCDAWIKGKGNSRTGIHADWAQFEMPTFPSEPYTANFNYLLSDYSKADGALAFVPGSHRWRRWPSPEESKYWTERAHAVEAPMGSMIIWGDHTWHGSYPRTNDGLRLMLLGTYCRSHMQTQEPFRDTVTQDALDRNPIRFGQLMDCGGGFPFGKSPARRPEPKSKGSNERQVPPYLSLFDTEPSNGVMTKRPEVDYQEYDRERMEKIANLSKGRAIQFPDLYRVRRPDQAD